MINRSFLFLTIVLGLLTTGCIKETYDMNKRSKNEHLSPTMSLPAITGNVTFRDLNLDLTVRVNSLQLIDSVDNFLKADGSDKDNPLNPENFEMLNLEVTALNGFPLRVSFQMSLYNSGSHTIIGTVDAPGFLEAATVDNSGKASGATETKTEIKFTKEFLSSIPRADKIIFQFTLNTPNNGTNYVTIYSDYKIYFKAAVVFKPDINLK
jgi:hypothetical protein